MNEQRPSKELADCPRCGGDPGLVFQHPAIGPSLVWVKCECGLRGIERQYHPGDEKEAIAATRAWWNERVPSPSSKSLPRGPARIAAQIAHATYHVLDDYAEEDAQTGEVVVEIPAWQWKELNRVIDLLGDDPHEALHDLIGVNDPDECPTSTKETPRELTPSEAASFDKVLQRSPRRVDFGYVCPTCKEAGADCPHTAPETSNAPRMSYRELMKQAETDGVPVEQLIEGLTGKIEAQRRELARLNRERTRDGHG